MPNTQGRDTQSGMLYGSAAQSAPDGADAASVDESRDLLRLAEECHRTSTDYLDANWRSRWEDNLAHYNNEHAKDSRFRQDAYRNRNRLFRPKTRSIAIKSEAAVVRALFSTEDLISVKPENDADFMQQVSAEINQELLQYRLSKTIPWYQTVVGAWQNCFNFGFCVSYQYWEFDAVRMEEEIPNAFDEQGGPAIRTWYDVRRNKPCVDLLPPENLRFDVQADWRDVIGTSPFLERIVPLPLDEVLRRMEPDSPFQWIPHSKEKVISAGRSWDENESTRTAREGEGKQDPLGNATDRPDRFTVIQCREYFVRSDTGEDIVFWTIGHQLLIREARHISEDYFTGQRPFELGSTLLEAHKPVPKSRNELLAPIQAAVNKLANQRADNVDLALNKRYFLRRGQNIDVMALMRNVPGGGVYMDNPETDVKVVSTQDVTSSAYEEHNRLAIEMDEIGGNFSVSSVQSNRQLNETVGGMQMLGASSDQVTEYAIITFIKTWVEPVLRQLVKLEQAYEDDEVVLQLAAGKSEHYQRLNLNGDIPLQLLVQDLSVHVNVGIGNTDPDQRVQRFVQSLTLTLNALPQMAARLDEEAVVKEIMGGSGRSDGSRFFKPADQVEPQPSPEQLKLEAEKYKADQQGMLDKYRIDKDFEAKMAAIAAQKDMKMNDLYARLGMQQEESGFKRAKVVLDADRQRTTRDELDYKMRTGNQGI
jgi:hypothetical protein